MDSRRYVPLRTGRSSMRDASSNGRLLCRCAQVSLLLVGAIISGIQFGVILDTYRGLAPATAPSPRTKLGTSTGQESLRGLSAIGQNGRSDGFVTHCNQFTRMRPPSRFFPLTSTHYSRVTRNHS